MTAAERAALLPVLAAAFVAGALLADARDFPTLPAALLCLGAALAVALSASIRVSTLPALALLAALLGLLRAGMVEAPGADLLPYHGERGVEVRGLVVDRPATHGAALGFRLSVDRIRTRDDAVWMPVSGDVRVTAIPTSALAESRDAPLLRYGDYLELRGLLDAPAPFDDFDFPAYLERQGIRSVMAFPEVELISEGGGVRYRRWLSSARLALARSVERVVPEPQGAFGQAILLGIRDGIPDSMREDFRRSGASHLLAISGLHVGMALAPMMALGAWALGRRRGLYLLLPLSTIWLYALLAGASPSATRAATMGAVYLVAVAVGRPRSLMPALALAAVIMAALDPRALFQVSFQLSFAAMLGIGIYVERGSELLQDRLGIAAHASGFRVSATRAIVDAAGVTVAATAATAPLVGLYFGELSLVGLPTTLLTLPAVPLALASHAVAAVVGLVSEVAALPVGWLAWAFSSYIIGVASALGRVPAAEFGVGDAGRVLVWAYYGALGATALAITGRARRLWPRSWPHSWSMKATEFARRASVPWQVVAVASAAACLIWIAAFSQPTGRLSVVFADVGQGDMTIITTPGGSVIVVDGGPDPERAAIALGEALPFWKRSVDLVILTHPHSDHVAGLNETLRRYDARRVLERRQAFDSADYAAWVKLVDAADAQGAGSLRAIPGMTLTFDDGAAVEILGPPETLLAETASDVDNGSVVARVSYGARSFLLTGDVFAAGEEWLIRSGRRLDSDVLKVGHHGSRSSSSQPFVDAVSPVAAVISAGVDNTHGHPHAEVVDRLSAAVGAHEVFTTAERGSVRFETDGETLWARTDR